jgi:glycosyltransferase involved in cell wall biosynthesis
MDVATAPYPQPDIYYSPLKVFEYMAAGLGIVASDVGQISQVLRHEETALLCPPGDARALAAGLQRLRQDGGLRRAIGDAARKLALKQHTWAGVVSRIFELADSIKPPAPAVVAQEMGVGS